MRLRYVAFAVGTICLGLAVHLGGDALAPAARDVLGDALWAAMLTWWVSALVPSRSIRFRAAVALAGCFAVEVSQLVRTPALDAVRSNRLGHLVLGSGFDPRDLLAYTGGVLAVVLLDAAWQRSRATAL